MINVIDLQAKELEGRLRPGTPHRETYVNVIFQATGIRNRLAAERAKINADPKLSAVGKNEAAAVKAKSMLRDLVEVSRVVRKGKSYVEAQRAGFEAVKLAIADPVAEMRRAEVRAYLRGLPLGKRIGAAMELADDPSMSDAIVDAPAALSGLPPEQFKILKNAWVQKRHGPQLEALEALEEDLDCAKAVVDMGFSDLKREIGLPDYEFDRLVNPIKAEVDAR